MCEATPASATDLQVTERSPSIARDFVREHLCCDHAAAAEGALMLLASELTTDCLLHGDRVARLRVDCQVAGVQLVVSGAGTVDSPGRGPHQTLTRLLLDKICRSWSTEPTADGRSWTCFVPSGAVPSRRPLVASSTP